MTDRCEDHTEPTQGFQLVPDLGTAITTWHLARHRFQNERQKEYQDAYMKATDELGQSISAWQAEQPELFEQLRFWAHPEE